MIEISNVNKSFPTKDGTVVALDNVELDIGKGDFVSIVGPSGCGKSTLMMCVAGLAQPSAGRITIENQQVTGPVTDVGIVFQDALLLDWRNVLDNVLFQIEMRGLPKADYRDRALALLKRVGLASFENKYPWELSGGMRQRVALCRALVHDPPLLLMDEPFGALDTLTRDQMNIDLLNLCEGGNKTVLFITHSISEAIFLSDRVIVMSQRPGRVVEDIRISFDEERKLDIRSIPRFVEYEKRIYHTFRKLGVLSG
ncbi:MAG: ABC transporter ATP-binding protein [Pseudolabrys sp.]|nr:ABC transporter ATP-binding protein [Pseudolabrys sp.]